MTEVIQNIRYDKAEETLYILDQSLLPNEEKIIALRTAEEMYDAIKALRVRGAPAIGICAAYSLYVLARQIEADTAEDFFAKLEERAAYLNSSRPTAVNLSWALREMLKVAKENQSLPVRSCWRCCTARLWTSMRTTLPSARPSRSSVCPS